MSSWTHTLHPLSSRERCDDLVQEFNYCHQRLHKNISLSIHHAVCTLMLEIRPHLHEPNNIHIFHAYACRSEVSLSSTLFVHDRTICAAKFEEDHCSARPLAFQGTRLGLHHTRSAPPASHRPP